MKLLDMMTLQQKVIAIGAIAGAVVAIAGAYSLGSGMLISKFGEPPYASVAGLEVLVQYNASELSAKQIQIQYEIERLKAKCQRGCNAYEHQALNNYIYQWQMNQATLDKMRRYQAQQMPQYQRNY